MIGAVCAPSFCLSGPDGVRSAERASDDGARTSSLVAAGHGGLPCGRWACVRSALGGRWARRAGREPPGGGRMGHARPGRAGGESTTRGGAARSYMRQAAARRWYARRAWPAGRHAAARGVSTAGLVMLETHRSDGAEFVEDCFF